MKISRTASGFLARGNVWKSETPSCRTACCLQVGPEEVIAYHVVILAGGINKA